MPVVDACASFWSDRQITKSIPKNAVSASQNDDDEKKDAKDSTENSFDDHQYIDSSL